MRLETAPTEWDQVNLVLAPAGRNVYRPRSIPNSSPRGAKGVYGHMLSDTCHPAGVQETVGINVIYLIFFLALGAVS